MEDDDAPDAAGGGLQNGGGLVDKCPECGKPGRQYVELLTEPFQGFRLTYASKYTGCQTPNCRTTWYSRSQMREQLQNRARDLACQIAATQTT